MEGTGETDSPLEERRFELSVPPEKDWPYETIVIDLRPFWSARRSDFLARGDRGFESCFLQRGVCCEPDFGGCVSSRDRRFESDPLEGTALENAEPKRREAQQLDLTL
jgi:hypothetical protein